MIGGRRFSGVIYKEVARGVAAQTTWPQDKKNALGVLSSKASVRLA
jgi:hypothetical protein